MKLTNRQKEVLESSGHLLVTGGPGSGKTTISILKAADVAVATRPGQEVLFLSFARATISRVVSFPVKQTVDSQSPRRGC